MLLYAIKDAKTGKWWSHNHWGTVTSVPDLYIDRKRAEWQISDEGKCGMGLRWRPECKPVIVEMELYENQ